MNGRRNWPWLVGGLVLALGYNLPNLVYPLFEDSALFAVVGKWLGSGLLPYRDIVDQKPPLSYLLMALATAVLGTSDTALRLFELLFIVGTAAATGRVASHGRIRGAAPWTAALTGLLLSCLLWGLPERGQIEVYQTTFAALGAALLLAYLEAPGGRRQPGRAILIGAGMALAALAWLKPQGALLPLLLLLGLVGPRLRRQRAVALELTVGLALGAVIVSDALVGWLSCNGILDDFWAIAFRSNVAYLAQTEAPSVLEALVHSAPLRIPGLLWALAWMVFLIALVDLWRRQRRSPAIVLLCWAVAAFVQFYSGRYLFDYHKIVMLPPLAAGLGLAAARLLGAARERLGPRRRGLVPALGAALLLSPFAVTSYANDWAGLVACLAGVRQLEGERSLRGRERHYFDWAAQVALGRHIAARTGPDDRVQVLGRGAVFYLVVGRRPGSRFLITSSAFDGRRADHHRNRAALFTDLRRSLPLYVIVRTRDSFPWFGLPSAAKLLAGDPEIFGWLRQHYAAEGRAADDFLILRRQDGGPPVRTNAGQAR